MITQCLSDISDGWAGKLGNQAPDATKSSAGQWLEAFKDFQKDVIILFKHPIFVLNLLGSSFYTGKKANPMLSFTAIICLRLLIC